MNCNRKPIDSSIFPSIRDFILEASEWARAYVIQISYWMCFQTHQMASGMNDLSSFFIPKMFISRRLDYNHFLDLFYSFILALSFCLSRTVFELWLFSASSHLSFWCLSSPFRARAPALFIWRILRWVEQAKGKKKSDADNRWMEDDERSKILEFFPISLFESLGIKLDQTRPRLESVALFFWHTTSTIYCERIVNKYRHSSWGESEWEKKA